MIKFIKRILEKLFCSHSWELIERGTCDEEEDQLGWSYQLYCVERCRKCGKIRRYKTHWPVS